MCREISLKQMNCGGLLMLPRMMIRELGVLATAVLSQVISEYNYAVKNKFCVDDSFLTNTRRMADYLGITEYELKQNLDLLQGYELFSWFESEIDDTVQIIVEVENIYQFKYGLDENYGYIEWDAGLKHVQNPKNKGNKFAQSTLVLKAHMDKYYTSEIPIVAYQRCNDIIADYESEGLCFTNIENISSYISQNINYKNWAQSLVDIVYDLCEQKT